MNQIFFVYNSINILHQNINGLLSKSDALSVHIDEMLDKDINLDVICVTEHNMTSHSLPSLNIPNFTVAASFCRQNSHGGACIMVSKMHKYRELPEVQSFNVPNIIECCGIHLTEHNISLICVYRPPKYTSRIFDIFFKKFNDLLSLLCKNQNKIIICGDLNIDRLNKTKTSMDFEQLLYSFNLKLSLNVPTRLISGTCLDNFIQNIRGCKAKVIELALSDHTAQLLNCPVKKTCSIDSWYIEKQEYTQENLDKFKYSLSKLSFQEIYDTSDPNQAFKIFHENFKLFYDLCFPVKRIKVHSKHRPKWLTKGIKICTRRKREKLWKYRMFPNEDNKNDYKTYSNRLKRVIKQTQRAQNEYNIINSENKSKETWRIINKCKVQHPTEEIKKIKVSDQFIQNPLDIAEAFNNFYIDEVHTVSERNLKTTESCTKNIPNREKSVFLSNTEPRDIYKIIMNLKNTNSTGYDKICTKVIKYVATIISPVLSYIINLCIEHGIFPTDLKISIVKPLFKKVDREQMGYYRPVALIPIFSKIFEKVIYKCIYSYFEKHDLFASEQAGFRKNKNINLTIYNFLMTVTNKLDKKQLVTALYMDLTKAFDYVDHDILSRKLFSYGVRGNVLDLIKSYLYNRKQQTKITRLNKTNKTVTEYASTLRTVKYGVPQGSVLGPLLFLIYINDFPKAIGYPVVLFADDSTVVYTGNNSKDIENNINNNLVDIINWLTLNNLILNIDKSNIMTFKNNYTNKSNDLNITHNGKSLTSISSTKFLGLQIDSHLTWKDQIEIVCTKLNRFSYALYILSKVVRQATVLTAYYAYVASTLRYGLIFWGNSTDKERVFIAQKRCIRAICRLKRRDSCKPYFNKLSILTLPSLYILEISLFVKNNLNLFNTYRSERYKYKVSAFSRATTLFDKSVYGMATRIFNNIPKEIRETDDVDLFKHKLNKLLVAKTYYSIDDFFNDKF